jgi:hypothetical protein
MAHFKIGSCWSAHPISQLIINIVYAKSQSSMLTLSSRIIPKNLRMTFLVKKSHPFIDPEFSLACSKSLPLNEFT